MTNAAVHHAEVFYIDPQTGWAAALYDSEGNQVGDAGFAFHKFTAKWYAQKMAKGRPVIVFKKDGTLQHIID